MDMKYLRQTLTDTGCSDRAAKEIIKMSEAGNMQGALWSMRKDRCRLMDDLHDCGRKVDLMDRLIRSTELEIRQAGH